VLYLSGICSFFFFFFFQAEDGIRDFHVTGVQTCALPILVRKVLQGEKGKRAFAVREISPGERDSVLRDERFAGILTIPKDFDLSLWRSLFLREKSAVSLKLELNESRFLQGQWLKSAVESFREQINRSGAIRSEEHTS